MALYSDELIEEICERNDIVDVIGQYVKLTRKGNSMFGLCPFHNEKTGSFSVTPSKQMYYCFGCGAGGNVISFVKEYENCNFKEAIEYLADRAGIELPQVAQSEEEKRASDLKHRLFDINKDAATFYYVQLRNDKNAKPYQYLKGRQLSEETMQQFALGYSITGRNTLYNFLKGKGYSDNDLSKSGLFNYDERYGFGDKFWNRVMFPIMDVNKRVIGFGGRVMGDGEPKYLNSPETPIFDKGRNLYGLHLAKSSRKNYLILCEGYMDVISLHQAGFNNAVASLGTAFTQGQAFLIKKYVDQVYLSYDSDAAGRKAILRAIPILRAVGIRAKVINMKPYKDPDEFIKNLGAEEYEKRIQEAENAFLFSIECLKDNYDMNDPGGKTEFYKAIAKKLLIFEEEIERNNYIEAISNKFGIKADSLNYMVSNLALAGVKAKDEDEVEVYEEKEFIFNKKKNKHKDGILESQKLLLTWLIEDEGLFQQLRNHLSPEDFTEGLYSSVAAILFKQFEEGRVNPGMIINQFEDEDDQKEIAGLFNARLEQAPNREEKVKAIRETLYKVKENSLNQKEDSPESDNMNDLMKLIEEKNKLDKYKTLPINLK